MIRLSLDDCDDLVFHYVKKTYSKYSNFKNSKNLQFSNERNNVIVFLIFAQKYIVGTLKPPQWAVLTNTHNLCFKVKIRRCLYNPVTPSFPL